MKRYILTGAPGAGKTTLVRALAGLGHAVVEEAATDHIAVASARGVQEPWKAPDFIDEIVALQRARRLAATADLQFHDRSAVCTEALRRYLSAAPSEALSRELADIEGSFERQVLFIDNIGFVAPTEARRITYEQSLQFEAVHEAVYLEYGFELIHVPAAPVETRLAQILGIVLSGAVR